jgi:16S rRNA (cytidine1402-2'-O)-methyltransferase
MSKPEGILYVVATPIGNLDDMSARARRVLAEVALIAAEDTRRTGRLLTQLGISTKFMSLHEHNEAARIAPLVSRLESGDDVALVSDAGTPLVSDPGYRLVAAVREAGLTVLSVPGCCAAVAALSIAGLPTDRFRFEGFLPAKRTGRRARLGQLANASDTLIFYETARRMPAFVEDLAAAFGTDRRATFVREMTKLHEASHSGTLAELAAGIDTEQITLRGEFTVVVAGTGRSASEPGLDTANLLQLLLEHLAPSKAATVVARVTGQRRRDVYRRALALTNADEAK